MRKYTVEWKNRRLELGKRTCIMGILNVTPDSFSDGGMFFNFENAVAQAKKMAEDGADIIDIGGESTRPFSEAVSPEEEMRRVIPVIETLAKHISIPISIDTTKAAVAKAAVAAGASIINDISALRFDPKMAEVAAEYEVPLILMHMKGTPGTMQVAPEYDDLIGEIRDFFENAMAQAVTAGVSKSKLIIDPGIGFGKTLEHNLRLIRQLHEFECLNAPILMGPSRKAFIRNILKNETGREITPDLPEVEIGTQSAVAASVLNGAHIVRVHHVANTFATVRLIDAIKNQHE